MAAWFRKGLSRHHTAVAMIGAKPGDRVLVIGAAEPELAAEVALVTGLNGTTTVSDSDDGARTRVETAAGRAGALVEFAAAGPSALPLADGTQDVVVIAPRPSDADVPLDDAIRVLRAGGRIIIIEGTSSGGGLFRSRAQAAPRRAPGAVIATLERAGTRARRQLADVDGVAYYEARK